MFKPSLLLLILASTACSAEDPSGNAPWLVHDNFAYGELLPYTETDFTVKLEFSDEMVGMDRAVELQGDCVLGSVTSSDGYDWNVWIQGLTPGSECTVTISGAANEQGVPLESPVIGTIRVDVEPSMPIGLNVASGCEDSDIELSWSSESTDGEFVVEVDLGLGWVTDGVSNVGTNSAIINLPASGSYPWQVTHVTTASSASAISTVTVGVPPTPVPIDWPSLVYDSLADVTFAIETDMGMPSYEWSLVPGATLVSGDGTNSIAVNFDGASSGTLSVRAINDCGSSEPASIALEVRPDFDVVFPDSALEACVRDLAQIPAPDPMPVSLLAGLTQLGCVDVGITDLTGIENLTGLTRLVLWQNPITDLSPIAGLTDINLLFLGGTSITSIAPLAGLTKLDDLAIYSTGVGSLNPIAKLPKLRILNARDTGVSNLTPLASLPALEVLDIGSTSVTNLTPLATIGTLKSLNASYNDITDVSPLGASTGLEELIITDSPLSDLAGLETMTGLVDVDLSFNQIVEVGPLAPLSGLRKLLLAGNDIVDLTPLSGLTGLTELRIPGNQVADIAPLEGLTGLTWLTLENNQIVDVSPLKNLNELTQLWLYGNQIADISIFAANFDCSSSTDITFIDNLLDSGDCSDVSTLISAGCSVTTDSNLGC